MNYFVKRGDQQYGPYTLAALQQYVAQGNISRQDMARSEAMTDWVEVSTIIGNVAVSAPAAFGAAPANMVMPAHMPPKLHWAVVLALGVVTLGIFIVIWVFVQASWIRKVRPQSKAMFYLLGYVGGIVMAVALNGNGMAAVFQLAGVVVYLIGIFMMRSDIEEYWTTIAPAGRSLSGVMTFFFNGIYFQYCLNELREVVENSRAAAAAV